MSASTESIRSVTRIIDGVRTLEGGGFLVRRPFPTLELSHFDPFLLLDEMGPADFGPGEAKGAPDHPHRGFETVTYLLEGQARHRDSAGNSGKLASGDVQWMTAGAGVVHSEMPDDEILRRGGRMHGFQLWVNLPRRDKMIAPRYQDTPAERIPIATTPDGTARVKVIAGEALGVRAVIETRVPISYHHWTLQPGARVVVPMPRAFNAFAYVVSGETRVGARRVTEGQTALFATDGEGVALDAPTDASVPAQLLVIGGTPLREPIARWGPFVMNTKAEIVQAIDDYQSGRMGRIAA